MRKYVYVFGIVYSLLTFMVGWSHYQEHDFEIFNIGMMSITAITGFLLGYDWSKQQDKKMEQEERDIINMESN
jgi:hypothetical protein